MKLVLTNISNAMMLKRLSLWAFMLTTISCCLWTTGIYADPGAAPEFNLEETFQGGPCMTDFSVTPVGDCCYHFEDLTPNGDANCPKWEIFDPVGNLIATAPGEVLDFCFTVGGMYVVCYYDCCTLADGTLIQDTVCKDLDIDCQGCTPDANFSVTDLGDCCYHFEDLTPELDPNDPCDRWDILDASGNIIGGGVGEFIDFCFPISGVYQICHHDCCVDSTGAVVDHTHCIDLEVDCGGDCEVDPHFQIVDLGDCCYHFEDLTIDANGSNCQAWDITDASGNLVSSGMGFAHDYCFLTSGTYTICYTDCCINPDGTMNTATHCETIDVECECQPYNIDANPVLSTITQIDCISMTMIFSISPTDGYCIDWVYDGITYTAIFDAALNYYSVSFPTPCPGDYEGEAIIYCCDDPSTAVSFFQSFTVDHDCCCTPDATFSTTDLGDCCYRFEDLTPDPFGNNCSQWEVTDAFGNIILTGHFGQTLDHCFLPGTYTICYTDCCTQPNGIQVFDTYCETIEVDCAGGDCDVDALFSTTDLGDCCYHFEDLTPDPMGNNCSQWEVTDQFGNVIVTGHFGFALDHCFPTGVYTICYTDCCTLPDGTQIFATHCETLEVDCGCDVDALFSITDLGDCCYRFEDLTPDPIGNNCSQWEITDAAGNHVLTGVFGSTMDHCFLVNGVYTICYQDCCTQPDGTIVYATHCETIEVECACTPDPLFSVTDMGDCCYRFTDLTPESDPNDPCDTWEIYDAAGTVLSAGFSEVYDFCFPSSGMYVICNTDCCINADGTVTALTHCIDLLVECECTPDPLFSAEPTADCCYHFEDLTPETDPNDPCDTWEVFDALGNVIAGSTGEAFDFCFPGTGTYVVCHTDCCHNSDGTITSLTHCIDISVDCCTPDATFTYDMTDDCCYVFSDLTPEPDSPNDPCDRWEIFDALGNVIASAQGDIFTYCFSTSGTFVVCHTDCCINADGTMTQDVHCIDLQVDCGCTPDPLFIAEPTADCCYHFEDLTPELDPNDPCDHWEVFDALGNVIAGSTGEAFDFCFPGTGTYVVCYTDCCINADGTITSLTHCIDISVDCCTPDATFNYDMTDDCCYVFSDLTPEPDSPNDPCDRWEIFDALGNVIASAQGDIFTYCFSTSGTFVVCHTDCCINADGTMTQDVHCIDLQVDCGCTPDPLFIAEPTADCCYHFEDLTPELDPNDPCDHWEVFDALGNVIAGSTGEAFDFCFPGTGTYVVCYTDCCINADGTITSLTHCIDISVDCCTPDATFNYDMTDDCCYVFSDLTPEPDFTNDPCDKWEIYDLLGNVIATAQGDIFNHCFTASGTYVVCHTDCCINADGTMTQDVHCIDLVVDCGCEVPDFISFTYFGSWGPDCESGFCLDQVLDPAKYCSTWYWGDGTQSDHPVDVCPVHNYDCDGIYDVCVDVFCCDDPSQRVTACQTVEIDCECNLPTDVDFNILVSVDDCSIGTILNMPNVTCPDEICWTWDLGDGNTQVGGTVAHTYANSGTYTVCLNVFCCDDPSIGYTICHDVTVNCCVVPDFISFSYLGSWGPDCESGFCLDQVLDPTQYCSTWYWGDGTQSDHPVNVCPVHNYECDGIYEVCVDVYCCDDPSQRVTSCQAVEIDCECNLPTDVDFNILVSVDDCSIGTILNMPNVTCPDEICWTWDLGDGTTQVGGTVSHTYATSGTYTVCLNVFCCDDPSIGYSICHDVTVNCCVVPDFISFTYFGTSGPDCQAGFCLDQILDPTQYCSTWYWGDGTQSDHPVDECPVHNYECDGIYEVCVDVYCCDDPNTRVTSCQTVEIDCECNLPTDINFDVVHNVEDCSISAFINMPNITCPDEVCWTWDMGDGTIIAGGTSVNHTYAMSGNYTICLNVFCCDDPSIGYVICHDVTVDCPPCKLPSFIDFEYTVDQCTISTIGIESDDYDGNLCYSWNWGDGSPDTPGQMATHTYAASGTYIVCYTVYCCEDPSVSMTVCHEITVECPGDCPEPCELHSRFLWEMFPITQADGCCMQFFDVSVAGTYTNITSWHWDFGDGNTSTAQNPLHCYDTPGSHVVCLTITGSSPDGQCEDVFCWEILCDCEDTCPGDFTDDGVVNLSDLLAFLGFFGSVCP